MSVYVRNLKSAINKLGKSNKIAGNQLVFKEKEALVIAGTIISIPLIGIIFSLIMTNM